MFRALLVLLVVAAGVAGYLAYEVNRRFDAPGPSPRETRIIVERGDSLPVIANRLAAQGLIKEPLIIRILARIEEKGGRIRIGEYLAPAKASPRQLLTLLTEGPTVVRRLTVPEGATTFEALNIVAAAEGLTGAVPQNLPEGALLPETYHYSWQDSRASVIQRMRRAMEEAVAAAMATLKPGHPLKTGAEIVALASIVEKETALAAERPQVAAVFVNRLKRGMKLESDPTTIYAITRGKGPLTRRIRRSDLRSDDPYNTYAHAGLPPGPIASPGKAALMAAANPPETKDLFFVADGSGGHAFARTYAQHKRNVAKWRKIQRERGLR